MNTPIYMFKVIHYCQQMYLTTSGMCLEIYELDLARSSKISFSPGITMTSSLKKTKVKLDLLTDINMLLMVDKCIRGGICHVIH